MALESKQLLMDDLKAYSDGLIIALKQEKFQEAKGYIINLRNVIDSASNYLDSHMSFETDGQRTGEAPADLARTEAERAILAAKRAQEKAERLERTAFETEEESKKLKKAAGAARKEAGKAQKAAERAEKAESKAEKEARKASELANKANQAARRS